MKNTETKFWLLLGLAAAGFLMWMVLGGGALAPAVRAGSSPPCLAAGGLNISTGINSTAGSGVPDPIWNVISAPLLVPTPLQAYPITPDNAPGTWASPPAGTNWIDANNTGNAISDPSGSYRYETSFTVPSGVQSLSLSSTFAADNNITYSLIGPNSETLYTQGPLVNAFHTLSSTSPATIMLVGDPKLKAGTYTLRADVINVVSGINPTGLLVVGTVACIPSPTPAPTPTTSCVNPPSGMAAWWPLDETTGATVVADVSGGGHNGTPQQAAVGPIGPPPSGPAPGASPLLTTPAVVGGSLYFYTNQTYVQVPHNASLQPGSGDFSISGWVYPVQVGPSQVQPIVDKFDAGTNMGYALYIQSPASVNNARLTFVYGDGSLSLSVQSISPIAYTQWHYVAVTVKRTATPPPGGKYLEVQLYVDGAAMGNQQVGNPVGSIATSLDLLIGGTRISPSQGFGEIAIDDIQVFDRALSPLEASDIFHAGSSGKCTPTPTPTPVDGPTATPTPCVHMGAICTPTPTRTPDGGAPTATRTPCSVNGAICTPTPTATATPCGAVGTICTPTPTRTPDGGPTATPTPCSVSGAICTPTPTATPCGVVAVCTHTATATPCVGAAGPCTATPTRTPTPRPTNPPPNGDCTKISQGVSFQSQTWDQWECQAERSAVPFNRIDIFVGSATQDPVLSAAHFVCRSTNGTDAKVVGVFKAHKKDVNPGTSLPNSDVWSGAFAGNCSGAQAYLQPVNPSDHPIIVQVAFTNSSGQVTPAATATPTRTPQPVAHPGDADCNGTVNSIDSAVILQFVAGLTSLRCDVFADANHDGNINSVDALYVLQYVAGFIHSL